MRSLCTISSFKSTVFSSHCRAAARKQAVGLYVTACRSVIYLSMPYYTFPEVTARRPLPVEWPPRKTGRCVALNLWPTVYVTVIVPTRTYNESNRTWSHQRTYLSTERVYRTSLFLCTWMPTYFSFILTIQNLLLNIVYLSAKSVCVAAVNCIIILNVLTRSLHTDLCRKHRAWGAFDVNRVNASPSWRATVLLYPTHECNKSIKSGVREVLLNR